MRDGDALAGLVVVFLPLDALDWRRDRGGHAPFWRALVDSQHDRLFLLPGEAELEDPSRLAPPPRPADAVPGRPWRFYSDPPDAPGLLVAVTPLISERLDLVDAIPIAELEAQAFHSALPRMVAPLAVLAVALVAAYVAMDRLVLRHLLHLARITRAFGRGRLTVRPNLPADAPREIAALADDLAATADVLQTRQTELEAAVKANRLLLMEVYHRVKNNLQMVGSFVSLQARRARDPASRAALEPIRARVHAMSLVHEMLYRSADLETVSLDGLLAEVARSIVNAGAPPPELTLDLDPRVETQERAIPFALFVNECVTNAVRHAAPQGRREVRLSLRALDDGGLELSVENDAPEPDEDAPEDGLGSRLIVAFARQIRGELRTEREGGVYRVTLLAPPASERPEPDDPERVF
jgi:two-component sensor histidine kinase